MWAFERHWTWFHRFKAFLMFTFTPHPISNAHDRAVSEPHPPRARDGTCGTRTGHTSGARVGDETRRGHARSCVCVC
eukprot:414959-Prymnesium_polylepis.1